MNISDYSYYQFMPKKIENRIRYKQISIPTTPIIHNNTLVVNYRPLTQSFLNYSAFLFFVGHMGLVIIIMTTPTIIVTK